MDETQTCVFVRALTLEAFIGVYAHERTHSQKLIVDVELTLDVARFETDDLTATMDYDVIAAHARALAASHIDLIETFAERLAARCLEDRRVRKVRVRIEKPGAIRDAVAGVELIRTRAA